MKFTPLHIAAFRDASRDLNPLHLDADYARRSQFGRPVVYGMAAVLMGLGRWSQGRTFRLRTLRAIFRKALMEGEAYEVKVTEEGSSLDIRFQKGPVDYAVITCEWEPWEAPDPPAGSSDETFSPLPVAGTLPVTAAHVQRYGLDAAGARALEAAFGLHPGVMPGTQLATLLWASYHVGMCLPGQQALFSEFQVEFQETAAAGSSLEIALEEADFDDRFNRYIVEGRGTGIVSLRIAAFQRPLPVDFPLDAMSKFANGEQPLAGKVVFVSGATRGFGAAMARMAALAGARLALNYRGDRLAVEALAAELRAVGAEVRIYAADMADSEAVATMAAGIVHDFGQLDLIVNNAAPPIRDLQFLEQDNAHLQQFVQQNLAITLETARQLLPILRPHGQFLHVSTKYLVSPVRGFAHYLTAKAAQEALVQALSLESRDHRFLVIRLPRILTDQTNLAFDFDPPRHPGEVAREAILALGQADGDPHFRVVELFD